MDLCVPLATSAGDTNQNCSKLAASSQQHAARSRLYPPGSETDLASHSSQGHYLEMMTRTDSTSSVGVILTAAVRQSSAECEVPAVPMHPASVPASYSFASVEEAQAESASPRRCRDGSLPARKTDHSPLVLHRGSRPPASDASPSPVVKIERESYNPVIKLTSRVGAPPRPQSKPPPWPTPQPKKAEYWTEEASDDCAPTSEMPPPPRVPTRKVATTTQPQAAAAQEAPQIPTGTISEDSSRPLSLMRDAVASAAARPHSTSSYGPHRTPPHARFLYPPAATHADDKPEHARPAPRRSSYDSSAGQRRGGHGAHRTVSGRKLPQLFGIPPRKPPAEEHAMAAVPEVKNSPRPPLHPATTRAASAAAAAPSKTRQSSRQSEDVQRRSAEAERREAAGGGGSLMAHALSESSFGLTDGLPAPPLQLADAPPTSGRPQLTAAESLQAAVAVTTPSLREWLQLPVPSLGPLGPSLSLHGAAVHNAHVACCEVIFATLLEAIQSGTVDAPAERPTAFTSRRLPFDAKHHAANGRGDVSNGSDTADVEEAVVAIFRALASWMASTVETLRAQGQSGASATSAVRTRRKTSMLHDSRCLQLLSVLRGEALKLIGQDEGRQSKQSKHTNAAFMLHVLTTTISPAFRHLITRIPSPSCTTPSPKTPSLDSTKSPNVNPLAQDARTPQSAAVALTQGRRGLPARALSIRDALLHVDLDSSGTTDGATVRPSAQHVTRRSASVPSARATPQLPTPCSGRPVSQARGRVDRAHDYDVSAAHSTATIVNEDLPVLDDEVGTQPILPTLLTPCSSQGSLRSSRSRPSTPDSPLSPGSPLSPRYVPPSFTPRSTPRQRSPVCNAYTTYSSAHSLYPPFTQGLTTDAGPSRTVRVAPRELSLSDSASDSSGVLNAAPAITLPPASCRSDYEETDKLGDSEASRRIGRDRTRATDTVRAGATVAGRKPVSIREAAAGAFPRQPERPKSRQALRAGGGGGAGAGASSMSAASTAASAATVSSRRSMMPRQRHIFVHSVPSPISEDAPAAGEKQSARAMRRQLLENTVRGSSSQESSERPSSRKAMQRSKSLATIGSVAAWGAGEKGRGTKTTRSAARADKASKKAIGEVSDVQTLPEALSGAPSPREVLDELPGEVTEASNGSLVEDVDQEPEGEMLHTTVDQDHAARMERGESVQAPLPGPPQNSLLDVLSKISLLQQQMTIVSSLLAKQQSTILDTLASNPGDATSSQGGYEELATVTHQAGELLVESASLMINGLTGVHPLLGSVSEMQRTLSGAEAAAAAAAASVSAAHPPHLPRRHGLNGVRPGHQFAPAACMPYLQVNGATPLPHHMPHHSTAWYGARGGQVPPGMHPAAAAGHLDSLGSYMMMGGGGSWMGGPAGGSPMIGGMPGFMGPGFYGPGMAAGPGSFAAGGTGGSHMVGGGLSGMGGGPSGIAGLGSILDTQGSFMMGGGGASQCCGTFPGYGSMPMPSSAAAGDIAGGGCDRPNSTGASGGASVRKSWERKRWGGVGRCRVTRSQSAAGRQDNANDTEKCAAAGSGQGAAGGSRAGSKKSVFGSFWKRKST